MRDFSCSYFEVKILDDAHASRMQLEMPTIWLCGCFPWSTRCFWLLGIRTRSSGLVFQSATWTKDLWGWEEGRQERQGGQEGCGKRIERCFVLILDTASHRFYVDIGHCKPQILWISQLCNTCFRQNKIVYLSFPSYIIYPIAQSSRLSKNSEIDEIRGDKFVRGAFPDVHVVHCHATIYALMTSPPSIMSDDVHGNCNMGDTLT